MLRERHRLRSGFVLAVAMLCIVSIPLIANGLTQVRAIVMSAEGAPVVRAWIGPRDIDVRAWSIDGAVVTLDLAGTEPPAPAAELAKALAVTYGQPVEVEVSYTQIQRERAIAP